MDPNHWARDAGLFEKEGVQLPASNFSTTSFWHLSTLCFLFPASSRPFARVCLSTSSADVSRTQKVFAHPLSRERRP